MGSKGVSDGDVKQRYVFRYTYEIHGDFHRLVKAYKLLGETKDHVQIRRWYGKRWYPKNSYWRLDV